MLLHHKNPTNLNVAYNSISELLSSAVRTHTRHTCVAYHFLVPEFTPSHSIASSLISPSLPLFI